MLLTIKQLHLKFSSTIYYYIYIVLLLIVIKFKNVAARLKINSNWEEFRGQANKSVEVLKS